MSIGIVAYGSYVPRHRIRLEEIAKVWGADAPAYERGLGLREKSVPSPDQDTVTMSVEAARRAIVRTGIDPVRIGAIYVGSESHPCAVKPSGTVVAEAIGATPEIRCADLEFACKAGSEGMYVAVALVKAGEMEYALGIGAETPYAAGIVRLDDGVKVTARIVDVDLDELRIGQRVRVEFRRVQKEGEAGILCYGYKFVPVDA